MQGWPGHRYSARELAETLCVRAQTVIAWIQRGWLHAAGTTTGRYRIRARAVRRLLCDHPSAARAVMAAQERHWRRRRIATGNRKLADVDDDVAA